MVVVEDKLESGSELGGVAVTLQALLAVCWGVQGREKARCVSN